MVASRRTIPSTRRTHWPAVAAAWSTFKPKKSTALSSTTTAVPAIQKSKGDEGLEILHERLHRHFRLASDHSHRLRPGLTIAKLHHITGERGHRGVHNVV
ncbi:hypothetical protein AOLI_G00138330 [Acnodon oligacanthus]